MARMERQARGMFILPFLLFLSGCACVDCVRFSFKDNDVFITDGVDTVQLIDPCSPIDCGNGTVQ